MKDRFDLEGELWEVSNIGTSIQTFADQLYDGNLKFTEDDIHTVLSGFNLQLQATQEKLNDTMCQIFRLNQYNGHPLDSIDRKLKESEDARGPTL